MKLKQIIKLVIYNTYQILTRKLDFRHYWFLSRVYPVPIWHENPGQQGNHCYGNWQAVKNAMGSSFDSHCMIEHGLYFGREVLVNECECPQVSTIYTYGPYRVEVLKEFFGPCFDKNIVSVGPYLKYSNYMMSERKRSLLKKKWGKVLLVFPQHSSPEGEYAFDYSSWLEEIERRAKGFDTVVISLFWLDVYQGNFKPYLNKGYVLACCGNRFDPHFLNRQKDMISLADMTMSNNIGTHVGYSVIMDKPHYIYRQDIDFTLKTGFDGQTDNVRLAIKREYTELYSAFAEFKTEITDEQKKLIRYYWGDF